MSVALSQSVVPQLAGQGCAAYAQQTGSLCDIVVRFFKRRHYLLLLYRLVSESQFNRHYISRQSDSEASTMITLFILFFDLARKAGIPAFLVD